MPNVYIISNSTRELLWWYCYAPISLFHVVSQVDNISNLFEHRDILLLKRIFLKRIYFLPIQNLSIEKKN